MILKAHVGIGLQGKEGNQASNFADFSIVKFKDLRRIMFWHGRTFGSKLGLAVKFGIYKNIIFALP